MSLQQPGGSSPELWSKRQMNVKEAKEKTMRLHLHFT